jgi:hypothetical protein
MRAILIVQTPCPLAILACRPPVSRPIAEKVHLDPWLEFCQEDLRCRPSSRASVQQASSSSLISRNSFIRPSESNAFYTSISLRTFENSAQAVQKSKSHNATRPSPLGANSIRNGALQPSNHVGEHALSRPRTGSGRGSKLAPRLASRNRRRRLGRASIQAGQDS